jgi:uncharacterized membrane protein YphA (DoxX/SURF4 family)
MRILTPGLPMRSTILACAALAFLRIVIGLHFFLEGSSHLRDPNWSSIPFRKAAVGPLAATYQALLPETGDWSATLGAADGRSADEAIAGWEQSLTSGWQKRLAERLKAAPLAGEASQQAEASLAAAGKELSGWLAGIRSDLVAYRLEVARLAENLARPVAREVPFERERVAKKRRELAGQAAGWMADAAAIGRRLEAAWDADLAPEARSRVAAATPPSPLWKADQFVSWSLATIGGCLVLGLFTKFNAVGGALFLATVVASQPFWVAGAQATYPQWVEMAALLAIAALPIGGWSGLDYFLTPWLERWCPLARCCSGTPPSGTR